MRRKLRHGEGDQQDLDLMPEGTRKKILCTNKLKKWKSPVLTKSITKIIKKNSATEYSKNRVKHIDSFSSIS